MNGHVLVAFLESVVLAYIMQVVPSDDNCPLHLHLDDDTAENTSSDAHIACEWTLLIDVRALDCLHKNMVQT